jgi:A1 cistron-splicing factor AAR2
MMEDGEQVELEVADLAAEDERGEWAPEVVDLDESGRQRDLVSWND